MIRDHERDRRTPGCGECAHWEIPLPPAAVVYLGAPGTPHHESQGRCLETRRGRTFAWEGRRCDHYTYPLEKPRDDAAPQQQALPL